MTWTVCFVALSLSTLCGGASLEEFLQEKQTYLQEVDRLFYTFYFHNTSHQLLVGADMNAQHQGIRLQPLPSPDWSTHSITFDDVSEEETDEDDLDASQPTMFEEENYRPREDAHQGRDVMTEVNVFSGDSGLFVQASPYDDYEMYDDYFGSGNSKIEETTVRPTTLVVQETSTAIPVEPNNVAHLQCGTLLKEEINSCVALSLSVRTMVHEMSLRFRTQSGTYNASSNFFFLNIFCACVTSIVKPPVCDSNTKIVEVVRDAIVTFAYRRNDSDHFDANRDERYMLCFNTHYHLLRSCFAAVLPDVQRLEHLVRLVIVRAQDVSVQECRDLKEVQECVVDAVRTCVDSSSVKQQEDILDASTRQTMCPTNTAKSGNSAAVGRSLTSVVTLALSIITLAIHKQLR